MASIQEEIDKISVLVASLLVAQKNHNLPAFKVIEKDISTINESIISLKESIENIDTATKKEIQDSLSLFEEKVQSIKDMIPTIKDGETPTDEKLVSLIKPLIPVPVKGDKGDTPVAGIDFPLLEDGATPTEEELKAIIEPLIPVAKDGSPDTPAQIVDKLESLQDDDRLDVDAIRGVEELIDEKVSKIKTGDTNYYGGGARSFTDLVDTPNTYTGQAGKVARVNPAETGIEFTAPEKSFETVSSNLSAYDYALNYNGNGDITSIVYSNGVTKTLNYTGGDVTSIVLSGSTPSGISLTKTFTYSSGDVVGITYS